MTGASTDEPHSSAPYRKLSQNHSDGIAPTDLTCDELRAPKGFVAPSVDYQVVLNALMHAFSLLHRHAGVPVAASDLTARSDPGVTLHTNPEDLVSAQLARHTLLALATVKEDVIEHEVCSAFGHSGEALSPRRLQDSELASGPHLSAFVDYQPIWRVPKPSRQGIYEVIHAEAQPARTQEMLQTPGD